MVSHTTTPVSILHVAAHLGGGVGRALSGLGAFHQDRGSFKHTFACLETPRNDQHIGRLLNSGVAVEAPVDPARLDPLITAADIVQLEWWHHPLMLGWLAAQRDLRARLIIWAHTSGLHYPVIPAAFVSVPQAFVFTTPASLAGTGSIGNTVQVVHSSGGFDDFPWVERSVARGSLRYGYLGSLNPAKIHPDFVQFVAAVNRPDFRIECYGDADCNPHLKRAASAMNGQVRLHGETNNSQRILSGLDVFVYLLNPQHYGTTENALLEAMACGAVPIVMDNPVERSIVTHGETGWVVDTPQAFAATVTRMNERPAERLRMSRTCSHFVRASFSLERTARGLADCYCRVMRVGKRSHDFRYVFGRTPADWFLVGLGQKKHLFDGEGGQDAARQRTSHAFLYEQSKSSVFHFRACYPDDGRISAWAEMLEADRAFLSEA